MFSDPVYGPDSDFVEGTPKLLTPVELNVDGLTKIFDNSKGKDPLHIAYEEAVELENRVETSVRNAFTFDVTTTSETTVSGSYAGAELEEKLTKKCISARRRRRRATRKRTRPRAPPLPSNSTAPPARSSR